MTKWIQAAAAYLPWVLLIPAVGDIADHPGFILLQLVPLALTLLAMPGILRATRKAAVSRPKSIRWSVATHVTSRVLFECRPGPAQP